MSCICGHEKEDHRDESRECEVQGCSCVMYEEEEAEDKQP
jgi:hypothetical protein